MAEPRGHRRDESSAAPGGQHTCRAGQQADHRPLRDECRREPPRGGTEGTQQRQLAYAPGEDDTEGGRGDEHGRADGHGEEDGDQLQAVARLGHRRAGLLVPHLLPGAHQRPGHRPPDPFRRLRGAGGRVRTEVDAGVARRAEQPRELGAGGVSGGLRRVGGGAADDAADPDPHVPGAVTVGLGEQQGERRSGDESELPRRPRVDGEPAGSGGVGAVDRPDPREGAAAGVGGEGQVAFDGAAADRQAAVDPADGLGDAGRPPDRAQAGLVEVRPSPGVTTSDTASGVPRNLSTTVAVMICWAMTAPKTTKAAISSDSPVAANRPGRRRSSATWEPSTVARHGVLIAASPGCR
ncbi:hypothetical protein O1157_09740 [Streptomyces albogriseolus]